ncbi:hypothetical protein ACGE24_07050 [Corynebacterium kroppenstedtii]|uniref:hypothetical protein n=1 Tax=Corynebacterium sp. PCR 32 TaxID=3351342 RepID=UPI00309D5F3B
MLTHVNRLRHSHWLEGSTLGKIQTCLRISIGLGIVYSLSAKTTGPTTSVIACQLLRLAIAWTCMMIIMRPSTSCISIRHNLLPIRPLARVVGAVFGWRIIEAIPFLILSVYLRTWWPPCIAFVALGITGVVHAAYDDYLRVLPPVVGACASPLFFGITLSSLPIEVAPNVITLALILSLFGLCYGFSNRALAFLLSIPHLSARMYKKTAIQATLLGMVGTAAGFLLCRYSWLESLSLCAAVGGTSVMWWWVCCGKSWIKIFSFTLVIQGLFLSIITSFIHKGAAEWPVADGPQFMVVAGVMFLFCVLCFAAFTTTPMKDSRFAPWVLR